MRSPVRHSLQTSARWIFAFCIWLLKLPSFFQGGAALGVVVFGCILPLSPEGGDNTTAPGDSPVYAINFIQP